MRKRIEKFYQEREKHFYLYNALCSHNITIKELDELQKDCEEQIKKEK